MEDLLRSGVQSAVGLAFGLSSTLAWNLYKQEVSRGIKAYIGLSTVLFIYAALFFAVRENTSNRIGLQLVAMVVVIWALLGAIRYVNKEKQHECVSKR